MRKLKLHPMNHYQKCFSSLAWAGV